MTMMFPFIIMGATHGSAPAGFAPIAIGLGLTLIHLISIPVTNTSVNPARSSAERFSREARPLAEDLQHPCDTWTDGVAPFFQTNVGSNVQANAIRSQTRLRRRGRPWQS
jgi:glycerol uptake facilitator-like aquaporin